MTRRPDWIPPRKNFPKAVMDAVKARSGGVCEMRRCKRKACDVDHVIADAKGGPPTLENAMHLCEPCHARKTPIDVAAIAKSDRQGGRSGQAARRRRAKAAGKHRAIPGRKLQSKPISKPIRKPT